MKKYVASSLLFLILIGCSYNEDARLKVEEDKQISEIKESLRELERSHQAVKEENEKLQTILIGEYRNFDPYTIEEGDQVAGLKVTNVEKDVMNNELYRYSVSFNGGLQLEGDLRIDTVEGQGYIIQLSKEQIMQTPHTTEDIVNDYGHYVLIGNTEEFEQLAGTRLNQLTMQNQLWIKAEFSNFTYNKIMDKAIFHTVLINDIAILN
jgi:hypothetical protein